MSPRRDYPEYHDRDSADRAGRFRAVFGRIFGDVEHPLTWAVPAGSISGIRVRIHLLFIVYAVAQVLWSINRGFFGPGYTALAMAALFVVVLMHELGHCVACRWVGGEADEILMWPLGGLASCHPPNDWRASLITTLGGPAVNVVILPITSAALWAAGRPGTILFDPFQIGPLLLTALDSWWLVALWILHAINLMILAFNVLLPIFPLDGGRVLHALLWRTHGRRRSMEMAAAVGLVAASALAIVALVADLLMVLGIAFFCGLVCWAERQRLRAPDMLTGEFDPFDSEPDRAADARAERLAERRARRKASEQAELDAILAKIARTGMDSLSAHERRTLKQATKKKQTGRD